MSGRGCPKCSKNYRYNNNEIIEKFKEVHGNRYCYDKVNYVSTHKNVNIKCEIHGYFNMSPSNHLKGEGCPLCKSSIIENEIRLTLDNNNIKYLYRYRKIKELNGLELDFYLPDYNIAIECQGIQHFQPVDYFGGVDSFNKLIKNDLLKKEICEKLGIKLLYYSNLKYNFPYNVFTEKEKLIEYILNLKKNIIYL